MAASAAKTPCNPQEQAQWAARADALNVIQTEAFAHPVIASLIRQKDAAQRLGSVCTSTLPGELADKALAWARLRWQAAMETMRRLGMDPADPDQWPDDPEGLDGYDTAASYRPMLDARDDLQAALDQWRMRIALATQGADPLSGPSDEKDREQWQAMVMAIAGRIVPMPITPWGRA